MRDSLDDEIEKRFDTDSPARMNAIPLKASASNTLVHSLPIALSGSARQANGIENPANRNKPARHRKIQTCP
ncbi:MAG TPA: hypothetical protein VN633_24735 [Bryobacteraceae bacterium]|nr:hypothetical protein [Bryobacteraceae bacterium]